MDNPNTYLNAAARAAAALDELGLFADAAWGVATVALAELARVSDLDDEEHVATLAGLREALWACELALRLGSAAREVA